MSNQQTPVLFEKAELSLLKGILQNELRDLANEERAAVFAHDKQFIAGLHAAVSAMLSKVQKAQQAAV